VTIPGKGGRPRKWRSDVDRSRAYRARQRGDDEPVTIVQALDDGDELAAARMEIERLSRELRERRLDLHVLRSIVARRDREMAMLDERVTTVTSANSHLLNERTELQRERDELRAAVNRMALGGAARPDPAPPALPRHVRRQLERDQRRRGQR
jgi:chromosome segregation ATPase